MAVTTPAQAAEVALQSEQARQRELHDVRLLLVRPEFVRYVRRWIAASQCFTIPAGLPHDQVREHLGRADLGMKLWNEILAADPARLLDVLDLATDTPRRPE